MAQATLQKQNIPPSFQIHSLGETHDIISIFEDSFHLFLKIKGWFHSD